MAVFWIGTRRYPTKKAATEAVQAIRDRYPIGEIVSDPADQELLRDLIDLHPDAEEKIGAGVDHFAIDRPLQGKHYGFRIFRVDGTDIDFSFHSCLRPPTVRQQVLAAMSAEIQPTTGAYFEQRLATGTLVSDLSGLPLATNDIHVSHFRGPALVDISTEFIAQIGDWTDVELTPATSEGRGTFVDRDLARRWLEFHRERAELGLLSSQENLRRPRRS